ncbi:MAG TPA: hypothetical protein VHP83_09135 [Aggregatilineaceae bacterium]|nr:hypothetical protein [Aggregatilineaceae bacterium]
MPIQIEWKHKLPILVIEYSGNLTSKEYYDMCAKRQKLLDEGPEQVVVVADTQDLEGFPENKIIELCETIINHPHLSVLLVVLRKNLYQNLSRSMLGKTETLWRVNFFADAEAALNEAERLVARY